MMVKTAHLTQGCVRDDPLGVQAPRSAARLVSVSMPAAASPRLFFVGERGLILVSEAYMAELPLSPRKQSHRD
jgi:hypothetical protein